MAERLVEAADLQAGQRVLDVDCGSGNAALAAARCGCEVTGIDYVPELLERGRERAASELTRVCRPGGTIAVANWTPSSFVGQIFRTVTRYVRLRRGSGRRGCGAPRSGCVSCSARRSPGWRAPRASSSSGSAPQTTAMAPRA